MIDVFEITEAYDLAGEDVSDVEDAAAITEEVIEEVFGNLKKKQ